MENGQSRIERKGHTWEDGFAEQAISLWLVSKKVTHWWVGGRMYGSVGATTHANYLSPTFKVNIEKAYMPFLMIALGIGVAVCGTMKIPGWRCLLAVSLVLRVIRAP